MINTYIFLRSLAVSIAVLAILIASTGLAADKVIVVPLGHSATGNATQDQVLTGRTFSNAQHTNLTGTMNYRGSVTINPTANIQYIPEGYHDGTGVVTGDTDLIGGNIKSGVSIFGVSGLVVEASGTAVAEEVLQGTTFSNGLVEGTLTGSMPNRGTFSLDCQSDQQNVASGYYSGGTLFGDGDLVSSNVRGGVEIFDTTGSYCGHFFGCSFIGGNCIWTEYECATECAFHSSVTTCNDLCNDISTLGLESAANAFCR
ncbi:MAG: hypothetical protein V2I36_02300 [Desulfopila sp.]|jgi:hypothetical protein|nr:hypothetical protein [Desulfopila sp.]